MKIGTEKMTCVLCGREYETLVLDGHIVQQTVCSDCIKSIMSDMEMEEKE